MKRDKLENAQEVSPTYLLKQLKPCHLGMALFWACSMLSFRSSLAFTAAVDVALYSTVLVITSFAFNIATLIVFGVMNVRKPGWSDKLPAGLFVIFIVGGLLLLSFFEPGPSGTLLFFAGAILTGLGYGFFWGSWAEVYGRMHPNLTSIIAPLCFILTLVIYLSFSSLIQLLHIPAVFLMSVLPVLSWWALENCRSVAPPLVEKESDKERMLQNYASALHAVMPLLSSAAVVSFTFGFLWEASITSLNSVNEAHYVPLLVTLPMVLLVFLLMLFGRRKWDIELLPKYSVPAIILGILPAPLMFSDQPVMMYAFLNVGFSLFEVLLWSVSSSAAYDWRVSGFVVGGIGRVAFLIPRLAGILAGYFVLLLSNQMPFMILVMVILVVYLLGMWLWYARRRDTHPLFEQPQPLPVDAEERISNAVRMVDIQNKKGIEVCSSGDDLMPVSDVESAAADTMSRSHDSLTLQKESLMTDQSEEADAENKADDHHRRRFRECCDIVSERYNLTQREAELLPYLAQGYSARAIAEQFFVSENTVRTHIRHILEKTGVERKQDLVSFVRPPGSDACGVKDNGKQSSR